MSRTRITITSAADIVNTGRTSKVLKGKKAPLRFTSSRKFFRVISGSSLYKKELLMSELEC